MPYWLWRGPAKTAAAARGLAWMQAAAASGWRLASVRWGRPNPLRSPRWWPLSPASRSAKERHARGGGWVHKSTGQESDFSSIACGE